MNATTQAVVLAGGLGSRLGIHAKSLPKPMMDIDGRPFLDYLIRNLMRHGVDDIVLSVGHLHETIRDCFGDGKEYGVNIHYAVEHEPLGTGGALRNCLPFLAERFFLLNGDTLFDVNLAALDSASPTHVMALRPVDDTARYGRVTLDGMWITQFEEKGNQGPGVINGGVLCLNRQAIADKTAGKSSLEQDLLPRLAQQQCLAGYVSETFFIDIGLPDSLMDAQSSIPKWEQKPIAFLDRDGVLNRDDGHVHQIHDFHWVDGAKEAVRHLNDAGYHVVVVTNQAGIAKGHYTEEDFHKLTRWMRADLWKTGAHLDAVHYCPFHPDGIVDRYRRDSTDRKPHPGMLARALRELPHDPHRTVFIGDQPTDRQAAQALGIHYLNFNGGNLLAFLKTENL